MVMLYKVLNDNHITPPPARATPELTIKLLFTEIYQVSWLPPPPPSIINITLTPKGTEDHNKIFDVQTKLKFQFLFQ